MVGHKNAQVVAVVPDCPIDVVQHILYWRKVLPSTHCFKIQHHCTIVHLNAAQSDNVSPSLEGPSLMIFPMTDPIFVWPILKYRLDHLVPGHPLWRLKSHSFFLDNFYHISISEYSMT